MQTGFSLPRIRITASRGGPLATLRLDYRPAVGGSARLRRRAAGGVRASRPGSVHRRGMLRVPRGCRRRCLRPHARRDQPHVRSVPRAAPFAAWSDATGRRGPRVRCTGAQPLRLRDGPRCPGGRPDRRCRLPGPPPRPRTPRWSRRELPTPPRIGRRYRAGAGSGRYLPPWSVRSAGRRRGLKPASRPRRARSFLPLAVAVASQDTVPTQPEIGT